MEQYVLGVTKELMGLLEVVRELIAVWHWLSNLIALLTLISEQGITEGTILWLISGFASGIIAELVKAAIPSYLRPIFRYLGWD